MRRTAKYFIKSLFPIFFTLGTITTLSVVSMLYAKGYRVYFDKNTISSKPISSINIKKTGLLSVRSVPEGGKIYLNDKLVDTTNSTINSLDVGTYKMTIKKDGFEDFTRDVEVYTDQVVDITALLVLKGGNLNQITWNGVNSFEISKNGLLIAYSSEQEEKPGIWLIQLSSTPINIFSVEKKLLVTDTQAIKFSKMSKIAFSYDDSLLLVENSAGNTYIIDIEKLPNQNFSLVSNKSALMIEWLSKEYQKKLERSTILGLSPDLQKLAVQNTATWSYDGDKFFIVQNIKSDEYVVKIHNFEKPLPVGEKRFYENITFSGDDTRVYWYSDSKHILIVTKKSVELVSLDGLNKFNIFSADMLESKAYPTPFGDKIIVLYKFKPENPANLYTVSIR